MANHTHSRYATPLEADLTCRQITALLIDYVAGEMDAPTCMAFEAHLHNCPACTAFLATYTETIHATRAMRYEAIPEEMLARVQRFLSRKIEGTSSNDRLAC
jgi:anti-sigma factor RsiW